MSEKASHKSVDHAEWTSFFDELRRESDRAAAILAAAWIDELLRRKFAQFFSSGNNETRDRLFKSDGPFATFSAKITAAFCAGWLDPDVYQDLRVIQKIRNKFAHQIHGLTMETPAIRSFVESFRVPHREFHDWGKLKCSAMAEGTGIVFITDTPPENIGDPLIVPAGFTFRWAASWVIVYLIANLDIGIAITNDFSLEEHEGASEDDDI